MPLFQKGQKAQTLKQVKFSLAKDCYLNLRELSSKEFLDIQSNHADQQMNNLDFVFNLISICAVDDEGNKLFDNADDVKMNLDIGTSQFIALQEKILEISGIQPKN